MTLPNGNYTAEQLVAALAHDKRTSEREQYEKLQAEGKARVEELNAKLDAERAERDAKAAKERETKARERLELSVKDAFIKSGGTESEFDSVKDSLIERTLEEDALERLAKDRQIIRNRIGRHL